MQLLLNRSKSTPWYLRGSIPKANCLGAWQPKGAPSFAASKISLVNPSASNLLVNGTAYPTWAAATGWTFASASSQYLTIASAIAGAYPVSMVCRFNADDTSNTYALMSITAATGRLTMMAAGAVAGDPVQVYATTGANTTSGFTARNWFTATAVFRSSTSRSAYINAGSKGDAVDASNFSGVGSTGIGARLSGLWGLFLSAKISACAFYNIPLTDTQVLALHNAMVAAGL